jgi:hypothetical protein
VLKVQKWSQIALAIFLTCYLALLLPGVVGTYGVPLGCLYIAWAFRASSDHRLSAWLAFLFTLIIAVMGGPAAVVGVASLLHGQVISLAELSLELALFLIAATVVVLHGFNWRWLLAPATRRQH